MNFETNAPVRIIFGNGSLCEVGSLAKSFGQRALVVTGRDAPRAEKLLTLLRENSIAVETVSFSSEPEISRVDATVKKFRTGGFSCVIGFGGGSVLDAAKAFAVLLANDGELLDYMEIIGRGRALTRRGLPFIAIPTTAGTGSEVTRNAVLFSPEHQLKVSLRSPLMLARVAIVDPELTQALPPALTASTGLDALTQLIEPFVCTRANALTDAWCETGIPRAARCLRPAYFEGNDLAAREGMALASVCGGLALANAGLGAVHGFAAPLGGMFRAAHGEICAALLPHVMAANLRALRERVPASEAERRYGIVARWLTGDASATADDGVAWVRTLVKDLQIRPLGALGVRAADFAEVAAKAAQSSSMKANPIGLTPAELVETLRAAS